MSEPLKNPPLVEAVCEFRFDPMSKWDWIVPGRLFDQIGSEFSERTEVHRLGVRVEQESGKVATPSIIEAGPDRIQLKRPDGSAMVQVGPRQLIISHLRPYPNWPAYRELIIRIFNAYKAVVEDGLLVRMGLRYINQVSPLDGDYKRTITVSPALPGRLNRSIHTFFQRYELKHDRPEGLLIHQTGLVRDSETNKDMVMLDLDFISTSVEKLMSQEGVEGWLEEAHDRVEEAFLASLTPEAYRRLKEGVR